MKKNGSLLMFLYFCMACLFFIKYSFAETTHKHMPVTDDFITMIEHNAELKSMLIQSIAQAKKINPNRTTNPAQTLEEYYDFIDWSATALPWTIIGTERTYSSLYDHIDQALCYFYFINDQPLEALKHKGYYNNSLQYHEPYRTWLIQFTKKWGEFLSTNESWNDEYFKKFYADQRFGMQNGWYEDPSHWKSFNEFFARYLKSPDERPIASPGDSSVIASPADAIPQGVWDIDAHSRIKGVKIKSGIFNSISHLLGEDSAYKNAFADGTLTHTYLGIGDYHRYHFPVSGIIKEVRIIQGLAAVGGLTAWDPESKEYYSPEQEIPGWQNVETRGSVIIDTEEYGLVALLPIGMAQVSSVNFEHTVKVGNRVTKGDMLGYFQFGGSDFVILFQKNIHFNLTVPTEKDEDGDQEYKHILALEKYGVIRHVKHPQ